LNLLRQPPRRFIVEQPLGFLASEAAYHRRHYNVERYACQPSFSRLLNGVGGIPCPARSVVH
jgi:hypothetical protein